MSNLMDMTLVITTQINFTLNLYVDFVCCESLDFDTLDEARDAKGVWYEFLSEVE